MCRYQPFFSWFSFICFFVIVYLRDRSIHVTGTAHGAILMGTPQRVLMHLILELEGIIFCGVC